MTVRQVEAGVTIADDWKTWRASVRTQAKAMKTAINAVTTITDVPGLYVTYATASDGTMTSVASGHLWHCLLIQMRLRERWENKCPPIRFYLM